MTDGVRAARKALGRGSPGEALVLLWNELEPARIAGDRGRIGQIAGLAQRIQREGDEGEAREAERLLESLRGALEEDGFAPATARLDAEVSAGGQAYEADPAAGAAYDVDPEAEQSSAAGRRGNLVWVALIVLIILINVVGQLRDGG
jgi:hypothetical protein